MQIRKITKFILGAICGSVVTLSVYGIANKINEDDVKTVSIPVDDINNFANVYAITKSYYVESVTDTKLMNGAINGMLTNLDPHSEFLDQDSFKQLTEITTGSFGGLGIEVSHEKDNAIKVVAPIYDTPAYKAGVKSGDFIIKINGEPVSNMTLDQAVKKMRGKIGTKVTLTISRKSELKPIVLTIPRAKIEVASIKYTMITPYYGYIRVTNFQANTVSDLIAALQNIYNTNPKLKGLILDLRDDPGGVLQGAVGVAGAFLPKDSLIVYTLGRAPNSNQKYYAKPDDYTTEDDKPDLSKVPAIFKTIPMVVLINQGTASASEIVSGALQDYKRAKIVGTRSFGKGSVQTVIPLSESTAVKLTTALYYTPKGRSIQAEGIKPNIIVQSEYDDLYNSWDISEASLDNHLDNPNGTTVSKDKDNTPIITPPKQISSESELKERVKQQLAKTPKVVKPNEATVDLNTDFQLKWALNIIEGKPLPKQNIKSISNK